MHWDFYTLLSVLSGIVLIAASLAGPVVGTARERLSIFAVGAFSFAYGIWVATQTSGFFMFSVAPARHGRSDHHPGRSACRAEEAARRAVERECRGLVAGDAGGSGGGSGATSA